MTVPIATAIPGFALAAWGRAIDDVDATAGHDSEPDVLLASAGTEEAVASLVRVTLMFVEQMARMDGVTTGEMFERLAENHLLRPEARRLCADMSTVGPMTPASDGVAAIHLPAVQGWLPSAVQVRRVSPQAVLRLLVVLSHAVQHLYGVPVHYQVSVYQDALQPLSLMASAGG